jgi:hypothetical protein
MSLYSENSGVQLILHLNHENFNIKSYCSYSKQFNIILNRFNILII